MSNLMQVGPGHYRRGVTHLVEVGAKVPCGLCQGKGKIGRSKCVACRGSGKRCPAEQWADEHGEPIEWRCTPYPSLAKVLDDVDHDALLIDRPEPGLIYYYG